MALRNPAGIGAMSVKAGSLMIIGGGEDRTDDKNVLERFLKQCGGKDSKICVLTAASTVPEKIWAQYDEAFANLGARNHTHLLIEDRAQADDPDNCEAVLAADGIFITGGAQTRLLETTGDSQLHKALHVALRRGACIAGTSAGASAMAARMLASGTTELQAAKGAIALGQGYGFVRHFVIDQHFSERHRLTRLLSAVADNPDLVGIGIDEDTAFLIAQDGSVEVLGNGAVTIIDARQAVTNVADIDTGQCLEMADVRLHLLPSGTLYGAPGGATTPLVPTAALAEILRRLVKIS